MHSSVLRVRRGTRDAGNRKGGLRIKTGTLPCHRNSSRDLRWYLARGTGTHAEPVSSRVVAYRRLICVRVFPVDRSMSGDRGLYDTVVQVIAWPAKPLTPDQTRAAMGTGTSGTIPDFPVPALRRTPSHTHIPQRIDSLSSFFLIPFPASHTHSPITGVSRRASESPSSRGPRHTLRCTVPMCIPRARGRLPWKPTLSSISLSSRLQKV